MSHKLPARNYTKINAETLSILNVSLFWCTRNLFTRTHKNVELLNQMFFTVFIKSKK